MRSNKDCGSDDVNRSIINLSYDELQWTQGTTSLQQAIFSDKIKIAKIVP